MSKAVSSVRVRSWARSKGRSLGSAYKAICTSPSGAELDSCEEIFLDGYTAVFSLCDILLRYRGEGIVCGELSLRVLKALRESGTDGLDRIISSCEPEPSFLEAEYLMESVCLLALKGICSALKERDKDKMRDYIRLSYLILGHDWERLSSGLNPVAAVLEGCLEYSGSSSYTKSVYRISCFRLAKREGRDPKELAKMLLRELSGEEKSLASLLGLERAGARGCLAAFYGAGLVLLSALLSAMAGISLGEPFAALFLAVPMLIGIKPVWELIFSALSRSSPLLSLEPSGITVRKTRCAVVLSALIDGPESAELIYERLYSLYAHNRREGIYYLALCDLPAEQSREVYSDRAALSSLEEAIKRLNKELGGSFCAIVRKREYQKTQDEYMGRERKRGAILEAAGYLKSGTGDFYFSSGEISELVGIKYILAVDIDTEPYLGSVDELLGIILHPANSPVIKEGRVIKGFGILAPRLVTRLKDSILGAFSMAKGGIGSVSGYDMESSDFWQEVFGRASFCGKGLISVDALIACTSWLPEDRILSHDILEGELTGCAYAGGTIFTEGFPGSPSSYYKRLDRWIRGDTQNLRLLFLARLDCLAKIKLLDNLIRAVAPASVLAAMYLSFLIYPAAGSAVSLLALLGYLFPQLLGLFRSVLAGGASPRSFFTGIISRSALWLLQLLCQTVLLCLDAAASLRAVLLSAKRMITKRGLLDWTTSLAAEGSGRGLGLYYAAEALSLLLLASPAALVRLWAAFFSLMPVFIALGGSRRSDESPKRLDYRDTRELSSQLGNMWRLFDDYVTEEESWLPPDNIQLAPVYKICHRTSPTNIGMYMLSVLAACDRRLITPSAMRKRLSGLVFSLERMEKYHGNLYNWYDTKTLEPCPNPYVSSVDSGNLVCSMVALKEGLKEYYSEEPELCHIVKRLNQLIDSTELSVFFDSARGLMAIGLDPATGRLSPSRYDFLMSEARLTSFFAIASGQVPKSHWLRLSRIYLSRGFYSGVASYCGTMFEYFMPELFLRSTKGSLFEESLCYALWCQRLYAKEKKRPFGISESGFYAFDSSLSYRYMAHGVPNTGIKRGLELDYVVSPYSTYISLGYSKKAGMENLRRLKEYGMYSGYGFYEALDFTAPDSQDGPKIVRSYMAHHVGMSIIACLNILTDGIMQKRFQRDIRVRGAGQLLDERVSLDKSVYENIRLRPKTPSEPDIAGETECIGEASVFSPRTKLISNGEYTLVLTDTGLSLGIYRGKDVYARTYDSACRPRGAFFGFGYNGRARAFSCLGANEGPMAEFTDGSVRYYCELDGVSAGMRAALHGTLPCELRSFAFENTGGGPAPVSIYAYLEPTLLDSKEEISHPAYKRMFVRPEVDPARQIVTVTRSDLDGSKKIYLAIGFIEETELTVSFDREEVLSRPLGVLGLFDSPESIKGSLISEPDPCVFIRARLTVPPRTSGQANMFLVCAGSREELYNSVDSLRRRKPEEVKGTATVGSRLADRLAANILFNPQSGRIRKKAGEGSRLPMRSLWELSLSYDLPLILLSLGGTADQRLLRAYFQAYRLLTAGGIAVQMAVLYDDRGDYNRERHRLISLIAREEGVDGCLYSSGGIIPIEKGEVREELIALVEEYACHIAKNEPIIGWEDIKASRMIKIRDSSPQGVEIELPVAQGGFLGESYVINQRPRLPWCHVLSSRQFGTLVSDISLGFSYAFNSKETRLTPWDNDSSRDNIGERLILRKNGVFTDLVCGSAAVFSPYEAKYLSAGEGFSASTVVEVSSRGLCKRITVSLSLDGEAELAYYTEPCFGEGRLGSRMLSVEKLDGSLVIHGGEGDGGYSSISCSKECIFVTERRGFYTGDWRETRTSEDICAAAVVRLEGECRLEFYLSYGMCARSAVMMPGLFSKQEDTAERPKRLYCQDPLVSPLVNCWLRYQTLHARLWARAGFYQCSGAYGFRDQLQDAMCICEENPSELKAMILRSCMSQFEEGDVLHWRHILPGKRPLGIRTKISDDRLWLPIAVCQYVMTTGDYGILGLRTRYACGLELGAGSESCGEYYHTSKRESVYRHCVRAIDSSLNKTGAHGLMLIGTGDWNDGFNRLGAMGRGESVWLTEFFILVLKRFSSLIGDAVDRGELDKSELSYSRELTKRRRELTESLLKNGRAKRWYLRAYADDGTPIGVEDSPCCEIDSIAQSFAEFAGPFDREFTRRALYEAYERLVDSKRGVVKLFAPYFTPDFKPEAGYIQSYPPGLRENGGQYTHAGVWLGMALLRVGLAKEADAVLDAINPLKRSADGGYERYKTEPYYIAGDVYANKNCYSRGGWSIYTGSAGWYYRALRERLGGAGESAI